MEGTKVFTLDEFEYMIPMDVCRYCWELQPNSIPNIPYADDDAVFRNLYIRRRQYEKLSECKHCNCSQEYVSSELIHNHSVHGDTISARNVLDKFMCVAKFEFFTNNFCISNYGVNPAITLKVNYESNCRDEDISTLDIDHVH